MTRAITPAADLVALAKLFRLFRATRPSLVQTYTPKAGLLATTAAAFARVPIRVHGIVGLPLLEAVGMRRLVLAVVERLTYSMATDLICNSSGLRDWLRQNLTRRTIRVIGSGSINGVDLAKFTPPSAAERQAMRRAIGIEGREVVFMFLGRLVRDKGVAELLDAYERLRKDRPEARLVLVGDQEPELDPLPPETIVQLSSLPGVKVVGWTTDVRSYLAAADVFVLPSYREGLPNALLEASAMGIPSIASDINGCNEVVERGKSGLLVRPKDVRELLQAMERLCETGQRASLGRAARRRAERMFEQIEFHRHLVDFYRELLDRLRVESSVARDPVCNQETSLTRKQFGGRNQ
jgi:glycosyltransferase involved in cell wall biosynthesis